MKPVGLIGTGVLFLLLGTIVPSYAQKDNQQQDGKAPKQEQQAKSQNQQQGQNRGQQQKAAQQQAQPQAQSQQPQQHAQQQARPQGQAQQPQQHAQQQARPQGQSQQPQQHTQQQARPQGQAQQPQQHAQQQARPRGQSQQPQQHAQQQQQAVWREHRASNWNSQHRTWQQRGGYNGYRIPDDRYRGNFGPNHRFRISRYTLVLAGGYPRFQYGGFWFSILDPWPEYWSDDWYDNDDVYIEYAGDGYYMYDNRYPGVGIAISISLN